MPEARRLQTHSFVRSLAPRLKFSAAAVSAVSFAEASHRKGGLSAKRIPAEAERRRNGFERIRPEEGTGL